MDNKNVFIAIALSMSVLLFWGALFEKPKPKVSSSLQEKIQNNNETSNNNNVPNEGI